MSSINFIAYNCPSCIGTTDGRMDGRTQTDADAGLKVAIIMQCERASVARVRVYLARAAKAPSLQCSNEFRSIVTTRTISFHQSKVE